MKKLTLQQERQAHLDAKIAETRARYVTNRKANERISPAELRMTGTRECKAAGYSAIGAIFYAAEYIEELERQLEVTESSCQTMELDGFKVSLFRNNEGMMRVALHTEEAKDPRDIQSDGECPNFELSVNEADYRPHPNPRHTGWQVLDFGGDGYKWRDCK